MAKDNELVSEPAEVAAFPLSLEEWCSDRSLIDKRVELIGGFYHTERAAGNLNDTPDAFAQRYELFRTSPLI